jgi:hypothetical protein
VTATVEILQCEFSQAMFDRSREQARRAARFAAMPVAGAGVSCCDLERRCVAGAVALTADAVHDWVTGALLTARVPFQLLDRHGRHRSLPRWRRVPLIARALGRPHDFTLSPAHALFLNNLGDWHATLSYDDPVTRDRLCRRLTAQGLIDGRQNETHLVRAELAEQLLAGAGELFDWAHQVTGLPTPS